MIKTLKTLLAVVLAAGFAACGGSNTDTRRIDNYPGCFAYVENVADHTSAGYKSVTYEVELNFTREAAQVTVTNLRLPSGESFGSVKISGLPFTVSKEGVVEIKAAAVKGEVESSNTAVDFTSLYFKLFERTTSEGRLPGILASYIVNSRFNVVSSLPAQYLYGTTVSSSVAGRYETTDTDYTLVFDFEASTLDIRMNNTAFIEQMPKMNIVLEKVPFVMSGNSAVFSADNIIPKIGNTPYPGFAITDLSGHCDFLSDMIMTFKCKPETMPLDFTVNVDCPYSFVK